MATRKLGAWLTGRGRDLRHGRREFEVIERKS